jgi:protocatechuate 3,4-dioxygenase beta subunit
MTLDRSLLPGGAVVTGTVTDASTNLPIANVVLYGWATNRYGFDGYLSVTTDASGNYTVDSSKFAQTAAAAGISGQWMSINAAGYLRNALVSFTANPPYPSTQNFVLTPVTDIVLQGTITDRSTGLPIAGATVTLYNWEFVQVQTDGNGRYSITAKQFPSMGYAELGVTAPEYFAVPRLPIDIAGPFPMTLDRSLLPGGTVLTGRVTDASTNLPIANAVIDGWAPNLYGFGGNLSVTTDAAGNYAIDSSEFAETAATAETNGYLNVSSEPGFLLVRADFNAAPPFPLIYDVALPPTGVTKTVTVATVPSGLSVTVDGIPSAAPRTYTWTLLPPQAPIER